MSELTEQNLTRQQAEQEMACLRKIYASVRLLDPKMLAEEPCYPPWKNVHPCTSCVGREAMAGKCQCSKLETLGSSLYQVTARYVEVDGKPYVMEMILPLDASARSSLHSNELIYRDALTGAYNRRFYEEELKHKYLNAGVAMIDLDDFKLCNDTYGHSAGDAALRLIVSIIHRRIRSTDMLVRYGGDELLLILPDISAEAFVRKLKDINKRLFAAHLPEFEKMHVSAGIPISDALLIADKRMYLAKRRKNTVVTADIAPDAVRSENDHRPMVLIVDDSPMNRDILSEILCDDFEILEAPNGPKCLELLNAWGSDISIVLLDIMMPQMDGLELCSRVKQDLQLGHIPVVLMTAKSMVVHIKEGFSVGADDYIVKPFSMDVLICRINSLLESREKLKKLYGKKFSPEAMGIEIVSGDDRFTQSFFEIIEKNISNPELGVDLLSQELGLSRANLYRKLKAVTELSPTELIRNKRLEIAAKLLLESSYTVSEISVYTGFNSHAYFTNCFKSFYGYSPSEWVQRHNDKGETPK